MPNIRTMTASRLPNSEGEVEPSEYRAYRRGRDAQRPKSKPGAHRPAVDVRPLCRPLEPERASPRQSSRAMIIAAAAKQLGGMAKSTANIFRRCPEQDADLHCKVMIGQIAEHREINSVLGKALRVLRRDRAFRANQRSAASRRRPELVGLHSARAGNFIREVRNVVGGYSYEQAGGTDVPKGLRGGFKESFA